MINASNSFGFIVLPVKNDFCQAYLYVNYISQYFALSTVYFVLWFRIYGVFYQSSIFQQSMNKCFYCVHILVLPLLLIIFTICLALLWSNFTLVSNGCLCTTFLKLQNFAQSQISLLFILAGVGFLPLVIDFILLITFIVPLILHTQQMVIRGIDQSNPIRKIIKRVVIVAALSFLTELLIGS